MHQLIPGVEDFEAIALQKIPPFKPAEQRLTSPDETGFNTHPDMTQIRLGKNLDDLTTSTTTDFAIDSTTFESASTTQYTTLGTEPTEEITIEEDDFVSSTPQTALG